MNQRIDTIEVMSNIWCVLILVAASLAAVPQDHSSDAFKHSDPALLSATGRPQLVEFYHPS